MSIALTFATFWGVSTALLVADGSPCATKCGNVLSSTTNDMIVCDESAYSTTSEGQVYEACVGCEATSSYGHSQGQGKQNTSDLEYMLYNMRYATNVCLFEANTNPCITSFACKNIGPAIQYQNLSSSSSIYGYCDLWTDYNLDKCHACLTAEPNGDYLSNYISILDGACRLKLDQPATLPIQGNIFSSDTVNVTDPTPTATFSPPGLTGPLDSGAIAGIVIGGLVIVLAIVGCCIVLNGKRRRKAYLRRREQTTKNWAPPQGAPASDMFETPISQKPFRNWEDSPVSAATQSTFPPYFSPYSSQYNSPVSAVEGHGHMAWPADKVQNIGVAISPDHDAQYSPWDDKKGKDKIPRGQPGPDGFELQEGANSAGGHGHPIHYPPPPVAQAPMLGHPGYGRHGVAPQPRPPHEDDYGMPGSAL
ncbi:uncharacterized protein F4822DRAFT_164203 [Hypoxylon trugodes]|uniref:uncharacterized protein n=1 Tax=Hypoxylon trugodes TaxID=326681 RepID=UPI002194959C|nr:uncharacterized protein F4822DRAFT_164203 [Hypoxylon trugodes]KAI1390826.1 hypothetical protein F4822DRAFT_164203 [Hypoxylon trugodes]